MAARPRKRRTASTGRAGHKPAPAEVAGAPRATHALPGDLRIAACAAERDALLEAAAGVDVVALDASAVTRVDATGLQLLVALCHHQRDRGGGVSWAGVSEPLRTAAAICGLTAALSLPDA